MVLCRYIPHVMMVSLLALAVGCSSTKHVAEGEYLVDHVDIEIQDSSTEVKSLDLVNYLRQTPNHKVLGFLKLQLNTYNLSGDDTSKWYNRWLRRLGQPPVIFDPNLTDASRRQLQLALVNKGYLGAQVKVDTIFKEGEKKVDVAYEVVTGTPHYIRSLSYTIPDTAIAAIVLPDTIHTLLKPGGLFDRNNLDMERTRITERLRNHGYYAFSKEYITFYADTAEGSYAVDLEMMVHAPFVGGQPLPDSVPHPQYMIRKVWFLTNYQPGATPDEQRALSRDTVDYRDVEVVYGDDHYIKASVLEKKCFIRPGEMYRAKEVDRTYEALAQLGILRSINIEMVPVATVGGEEWLDAYIYLTRNKKQGITVELEGTNSEGDLGYGIGLTYQHRNLRHQSDLFTGKLRMNYESLSGNFSGLVNNRYSEYAAEAGITFPKFKFPFLKRLFKDRVKAVSEATVSFNYQERPEYTRIIAGAAWKYRWTTRNNMERRTFDLLDINYVYLPESTIDFINQIAPTNPLLRYSYEDHFIMRSGYTFYRTNRRVASAAIRRYILQKTVYSLRASGETAGNLLYALSALTGQHRRDGVYKVFGIQYSQYAKAEIDYSSVRNYDERHSLAWHVGAGIGVPYGNSHVLPFEKRFYAGGANGVRGWGVRTLGPGSYDARNSVTDFINQCGDIRLDLNVEYRMKLFWVFEGGAFVDAGNIWTIHNYENQPGGMFHFDTFWKQIALAYGVGLRMDFEYFLLRFDLGMKAHNPAQNQEHWPIIHPRWGRDATFHFSVGYPF